MIEKVYIFIPNGLFVRSSSCWLSTSRHLFKRDYIVSFPKEVVEEEEVEEEEVEEEEVDEEEVEVEEEEEVEEGKGKGEEEEEGKEVIHHMQEVLLRQSWLIHS